jgi:high affinity Mn2+ porin
MGKIFERNLFCLLASTLFICFAATSSFAQVTGSPSRQSQPDAIAPLGDSAQPSPQSDAVAPSGDSSQPNPNYLFDHSQTSRFWISGQANFIYQYHPSFASPYSGPNSFSGAAEGEMSHVYTLFTGFQLFQNTEILADFESAGGKGLGNALGIAGYSNLDVVRNPSLGQAPYLARFMVHQIIDLGGGTVEAERGPFSLATELPARRLEIRAGRFSMADFFDNNSVGSDSHRQFENWTVDNNGAYDYAADTRGYTYGFIVEYQSPMFGVRFGEALMPKVANGLNLDADLGRAHSENLEFEFREHLIAGQTGTLRFLTYANTADMGSYREAIDNYLDGRTTVPNIVSTREQGRVKYGFGLNFEQPLNNSFSVFGRIGWNEGHNESFAYTEVDNTFSFGGSVKGNSWNRPQDKFGLAFVSNGISADHREYLALGGTGFLLGDGGLNYQRENIAEAFYTAHLTRGITFGPDVQYIANPGYNHDRGPVFVAGLRLHLEF